MSENTASKLADSLLARYGQPFKADDGTVKAHIPQTHHLIADAVDLLRAAPETAAQRDRLKVELEHELQMGAEKNTALADARAEISRLLEVNKELVRFAEAYQAMALDVTSRGASARPTVKQLNVLYDQSRAALAKARSV